VPEGFHCPNCGLEKTKVVNTKAWLTNRASSIARQRKCPRCNKVFHTVERIHERPSRKLTVRKASQIRDAHNNGASQASLARDYGVSRKTIYNVVNNDQWLPFT
jgi:transcriptional regulator NrdR family protein